MLTIKPWPSKAQAELSCVPELKLIRDLWRPGKRFAGHSNSFRRRAKKRFSLCQFRSYPFGSADYQQSLRDFTESPRKTRIMRGFASPRSLRGPGNLKRALTDIRSAAIVDTRSKETWTSLCQAQRLDGDPETALESCNHAVALDQEMDAPAYLQKGLCEIALKQPTQALTDFEEASHFGLRRPEALLAQAVAHAGLHQYQDAHTDFQQAMRLDPDAHDLETRFGAPVADRKVFMTHWTK